MSGNNQYLKDRKKRDQEFFEAGFDVGVQWVTDLLQASLRNEKAMGGDVFGLDRTLRLFNQCTEYDLHFSDALTTAKEADVLQEELDGILREIFGEKLIPFRERYPKLKEASYKKPKKGWVD